MAVQNKLNDKLVAQAWTFEGDTGLLMKPKAVLFPDAKIDRLANFEPLCKKVERALLDGRFVKVCFRAQPNIPAGDIHSECDRTGMKVLYVNVANQSAEKLFSEYCDDIVSLGYRIIKSHTEYMDATIPAVTIGI